MVLRASYEKERQIYCYFFFLNQWNPPSLIVINDLRSLHLRVQSFPLRYIRDNDYHVLSQQDRSFWNDNDLKKERRREENSMQLLTRLLLLLHASSIVKSFLSKRACVEYVWGKGVKVPGQNEECIYYVIDIFFFFFLMKDRILLLPPRGNFL